MQPSVKNLKKIGVGAVVRDSTGFVMAAMAKNFHGPSSPKLAEAKALCENLLRAKDVGLNLHIVELDALLVIQAIQNQTVFNEFGNLLMGMYLVYDAKKVAQPRMHEGELTRGLRGTQGQHPHDLLSVPIGPITRLRASDLKKH